MHKTKILIPISDLLPPYCNSIAVNEKNPFFQITQTKNYLFNQHLLSAYYVSGTVLCAWKISVNKTDEVFSFVLLIV